ncbi:unnamed protein product [Prorocentrum cordatum]|uniref:Cyclic nucleotide-binding domain-containing protein n=1 Tax=Prorocentrum cordatum TaxID=2364126 RepID=A0ABN9TKW1_9DINO|nr:unnamed protein product [Polarella glacialis]
MGLLHPSGRVRLAWDCAAASLSILTGAVLPVCVAYDAPWAAGGLAGGASAGAPLGLRLLVAADAFWAADVAVNARTAFFHDGPRRREHCSNMRVVLPRRILARYARAWLLLDLLAAWPWLLVPGHPAAILAAAACKLLKVAKLPHLLLRLQNQVKRVRLIRRCLGWPSSDRRVADAPLLLRMAPCEAGGPARSGAARGGVVAGVHHGRLLGADDDDHGGLRRRLALRLLLPDFRGVLDAGGAPVFRHRRVGAHRVQSSGLPRRGRPAGPRGRPADAPQGRVDRPPAARGDLRRRVRQERQMASAAGLLGRLSPAVQRELSLELLTASCCGSRCSARRRGRSWPRSPAPMPGCSAPQATSSSRTGQVIQEVVFLVHGRLLVHRSDTALPSPASPSSPRIWRSEEAEVPEGRGDAADGGITAGSRAEGTRVEIQRITELEDGAWFGEACLFAQKVVRTFGAIAVAETELAVLPARGYRRVLQRYPHLLERHGAMHRALRESRLDLADLAWKPAD